MKILFSRNIAFITVAANLIVSSAVMASEAEEASPSIWDGDIFTSIFAVLLFAMMLVVLGKYAWGPILDGLQKREDFIRQQIKDAETARADAEKTLRRYETKMKKAEDRAAGLISEAREEALKITHRVTEEAQAKAEDIINQAQKSITNAKEQAVRDLHGYSAELAIELAGKILGKTISSEEHRELIDQTITELKNSNS